MCTVKSAIWQCVRLKVKMKASVSVERCRFSTNDFFLSGCLFTLRKSEHGVLWCLGDAESPGGGRRYPCEFCGRTFTLGSEWERHVLRHGMWVSRSVVNLTHLIPPVTIVTLKKLTFPNLTVDFQTIFNMNGSCSICSEHKISHKGNFFLHFDSCIIWKLNK